MSSTTQKKQKKLHTGHYLTLLEIISINKSRNYLKITFFNQ